MIPLQIDLIGAAGCYGLLRLIYSALLTSKTHSIGSRISSVIISTVFTFFFLDYIVNCIIITVEVFRSPVAILGYTGFMVMNGVLYWLIDKFSDKVALVETLNFVRTSVLFGNYFRLRDVDTQEQIGTHKMKELYKEVHGKPFTDDVIATPFDQMPTKFKKVTLEELKDKKKKTYPPEYPDQIASLRMNRRTDVSVAFRFQLLDAGYHPFLRLMEQFEIDPHTKNLSFAIVTPLERPFPCSTPVERTRLIEKTYESIHLLIALEWFSLYAPYINSISVRFCNKTFTEQMQEVVIPLMEFTIPLNVMRERADRITTISELNTIAGIQFFQP